MPDRPLLFDRYRLVRQLGRGAFATVYLADDLRMGRQVAIKVVEDATDVEGRVLREARAAAKLDHPHIVSVHEVLREEDRTYLFTEYVEGQTLRQAFAKRTLGDAELVVAGIQICRGLEHAHRRGVIHRDIKPENIMLVDGEDVDVRIMDFGVAQLEDVSSITQEGDLIGTLAYMAPEQLQGGSVDRRADVYSVALVLYEGLTGSNPLRGMPLRSLLEGVPHRQLPSLRRARPDLPPELAEALDHALTPDPEQRLDGGGLRRALEKGHKHLPEPEEGAGLWDKTVRALARDERLSRLWFAGRHVAAGLLSLAALLFLLRRLPFYPEGALVPLVVACSFLSLMWPTGGGAITLLSLVPPVFAFSRGWGVLFVVMVGATYAFLAWRRLSWVALLPLLGPVLCLPAGKDPQPAFVLLSGLALALPLAAGMAAGMWGPLLGLWTGFTTALAAGFQGWAVLPWTFSTGGDAVLQGTRYEPSVGAVALAAARFLDQRPELVLQALFLAALAFPLQVLLRGSPERRLWVSAGYVSLVGAGLMLLPPLGLGVPGRPWLTFLALLPCAIIALVSSVVVPTADTGRLGVKHGVDAKG
ncbi:MAG: serine/threonine protein kinase [Gaiellales bacterium]|nr:serine/threonine protein kinase [Gaiellales bacterium]